MFNYRCLTSEELEKLIYCGDKEAARYFIEHVLQGESYIEQEVAIDSAHEEGFEEGYELGFKEGYEAGKADVEAA